MNEEELMLLKKKEEELAMQQAEQDNMAQEDSPSDMQQRPVSEEEKQMLDTINRYKSEIDKPAQELTWKDRLPDMLAAAHNIINYGSNTRLPNLELGYADKIQKQRASAKDSKSKKLDNLQKMYGDLSTRKENSFYKKARLDADKKATETRNRVDQEKFSYMKQADKMKYLENEKKRAFDVKQAERAAELKEKMMMLSNQDKMKLEEIRQKNNQKTQSEMEAIRNKNMIERAKLDAKLKEEAGKVLTKKQEEDLKIARRVAEEKKKPKTKLQEEREKNIADRYDSLQEQIPNTIANIEEASALIKEIEDGNLSTGPGAKLAGDVGSFFGTKESTQKQKLDSLAEKAARAQLKANGEVRPTDADVEGMKRAMFNLGNTEEANVDKLKSFIRQQKATINEYDQMKEKLQKGEGLEDFILKPTYKSKKESNPKNKAARKWAMENPDDPRAEEILKRIGR